MTPDSPLNAVSFDVEEYFHALNFRRVLERAPRGTLERRVERGCHRILDILSRCSTRATFFVLGDVAVRIPKLVRAIAGLGHEIASHGMTHRTAFELGGKGFCDEARESKMRLEDMTGAKVTGFRASTFSITRKSLWALDILAEEGYGYDSSIFPVYHDRYGIPDFPTHPVTLKGGLIELPPMTLKIFNLNLPLGGGGYFRLFPGCLTRLGVRRMNAASRPAVLYLHPWEFDPEQPRHGLGGLKTFRHYVNLSRTSGRLEALLRRHAFDTMNRIAGSTCWPEFGL
jgi:polysaccharide deacetylase family protein (PEP-CTERM system associated)